MSYVGNLWGYIDDRQRCDQCHKNSKGVKHKNFKKKRASEIGVALVASFYAISVTKIQKELNTKILKRKEHRKFGAKLKRS